MAEWRVVTTARDRAKTLFQGPEKAAREYVQNHFPRPHTEPPGGGPEDKPTPDVVLVSPEGAKEQYHADDGFTPHGEEDGSALA